MQVKHKAILVVSLICLAALISFVVWPDGQLLENVDAQTTESKTAVVAYSDSSSKWIPEFKIVGNDCTKEDSCFLFVYVEGKYFTKANLEVLSLHLLDLNQRRAFLKVTYFDDLAVAEGYLLGKRNWAEIADDVRGVYSYDEIGKYGDRKEELRLRLRKDKRIPMRTIFSRKLSR